MSKINSMAAVAVIAASLLGGAAYPHPQLQSADPAPGAATTTSPKLNTTAAVRKAFLKVIISSFAVQAQRDGARNVQVGEAR